MPLFGRLKHGVDVTKFKADQLLRINRVQGEIGDLRREILGVREKITNAVIDLHKQSTLSYPELQELCIAIDKIESQIAEKERQIASIRAEVPPQPVAYPPAPIPAASTNPCPNCHFAAPVGAAFCPNCGKPMPAPSETISAEPASNSSKCANCGLNIPAKAAFCPNCGKPVTSASETPAQEVDHVLSKLWHTERRHE